MTKFLMQKCSLTSSKVSALGEVQLNDFGEPLYEAPIDVRCRKEPYTIDIQTINGHTVKTSTRYFLDDKIPVKVNDLIDGKSILECHSYTNQIGKVEGFEVFV